MCLILFAYQRHPRYHLILAANRDEFYARPTAPLDFWADHPNVLAGRDLEQGGTWLGVTRNGRIAAITNYRNPKALKSNAPSRGQLVLNFLNGALPPQTYLRRIQATADQYNGFNLIVGDGSGLYYFSNCGRGIQPLTPGVYGLSNHLLDTPWPKVTRGKRTFATIMEENPEPSEEVFFDLLQNQSIVPDERLPRTGVSQAWERMLSPIFITSPAYGTRCSSVVMIHATGHIRFHERTWQTAKPSPSAKDTRCHEIIPTDGPPNG